jgi:hypothetical protein
MTPQLMPTPVRIPPELKEWVKASAEANHRSVNAEIITLLLMARTQCERAAEKETALS